MLYLGIPFILFVLDVFDVSIKPQYSYLAVPFLVTIIVLYIIYIASNFIPGVYALFDCITSNFVTKQMSYTDSYVAHQMYHSKKRMESTSQKTRLIDAYYIIIILADKKRKSSYKTTHFHTMEKGKSYTVTFGKFSKVLISVKDAQGMELLQFDVD